MNTLNKNNKNAANNKSLGNIYINESVLMNIIDTVLSEFSEIVKHYKNLSNINYLVVDKQIHSAHHYINVQNSTKTTIDISISLRLGTNALTSITNIQKSIIKTIETLTNITIETVNISIINFE